ncbi:glycine zipper domain-containing protein [Chitinophagaceae bacterium LB-8]|jgi:membrane associated rhomboid family serine protease|uniref:Glycine zipper domain-containing protein n=1 Tax=Paraflavisolibacter caeni TaxID=2982496 RepID=A0A9X2XZP5_9BACT|nr:glycine zipper domain-containing protein [Paraflavisolibacter caeni]MCU7552401.1 glycine zipper domain-containing protein [Paraflavisolibacter caeni]
MPQSKKRHVHHQYQKPSTSIPARQAIKGRIIWALLIGVFGLLIGAFASESGYAAMIIGALAGSLLGYFIGKNMEEEARKDK